jgi:cyclase
VVTGTRRRLTLALLQWAAVGSTLAQGQPSREPAAEGEPALVAEPVTTGLYLIAGAGGHSLLRFSASGMILVNGKRPGAYRALMRQVRRISRISDLPVRALVVTDHDDGHAGNAAQFVAARIPVVAQDNAGRRCATPPTVTYERDYTIKMGGVEARLLHAGAARTDGDTVVLFPDLKVVAVGALYTAGLPQPDVAAGGSLAGWASALARILALDVERVVPDGGPVVTRAELQALKARIDMLVARAR